MCDDPLLNCDDPSLNIANNVRLGDVKMKMRKLVRTYPLFFAIVLMAAVSLIGKLLAFDSSYSLCMLEQAVARLADIFPDIELWLFCCRVAVMLMIAQHTSIMDK